MKPEEARIFISYARKDVAKVNELYDKLKHYGFSPWIDHKDLIGGMEWMEEIIETINNCAFFMACISKNIVDKQTGVLVREINEALDVVKFRRKGIVFIIPVRLEDVGFPKELSKYQGIDLFDTSGFEQLIKALRHGLKQLGINAPLNLRSQPLDNLPGAEAGQMIRERNFYAFNYWHGTGIHHDYKRKKIGSDEVVLDYTTGLMWQQGGSPYRMNYEAAGEYIEIIRGNYKGTGDITKWNLTTCKFARFDDWRLPTLEEAMSLMESPPPKSSLLYYNYIDPVFDNEQENIWTSDTYNATDLPRAEGAWYVDFTKGECNLMSAVVGYLYVRAVRSG